MSFISCSASSKYFALRAAKFFDAGLLPYTTSELCSSFPSKQSHSSLAVEMQLPFRLTASILKLWQELPKLLKRLLSVDVMQGVSTPLAALLISSCSLLDSISFAA